ncbi:hypothetical protein P8605_12850 [Streptomyces sp. T-3]|nr:hypothetical protein [Streptomyces sp. T-3]
MKETIGVLEEALNAADLDDTTLTRGPHGKVTVRLSTYGDGYLKHLLGFGSLDILSMSLSAAGIRTDGAEMPDHTTLWLDDENALALASLVRRALTN